MAKPIIFYDIGGTLMDGPNRAPATRFIKALRLDPSRRSEINQVVFTEDIKNADTLFKRFCDLFPGLQGFEHVDKIWNQQYDEGYILKGAEEVLEKTVKAGIRLGIISNIWLPYFECFNRLFNKFSDHIEVVIASHEVGLRKPDPEIFRLALVKAGLAREGAEIDPDSAKHACIVGDMYKNDIMPAKEIGMRGVWIVTPADRELPYLKKIIKEDLPLPDIIVRDTLDLAEKFIMMEALVKEN